MQALVESAQKMEFAGPEKDSSPGLLYKLTVCGTSVGLLLACFALGAAIKWRHEELKLPL